MLLVLQYSLFVYFGVLASIFLIMYYKYDEDKNIPELQYDN